MSDTNGSPASKIQKFAAECYRFSHQKSGWADARSALQEARSYRLWQKLLLNLRRIRLISFFIRIIGWIFTLLQTGTLVLLSTVILFVALPLILAFLLGVAFAALIDTRKSFKRLSAALQDKRVYVLFCVNGAFAEANARALASDPSLAVLAVSPYRISSGGFHRSKRYVNMRQEGERLFLIRRHFYFFVRKHLLKPDQTALIY